MPYKSGYVAIVGKPNVGKSTVLNYLLGTDLAIVTPKPETTRNKLLGTLTAERGQINFIDTPGIHISHTLLGKHMVRQAKEALEDADLVLAVVVAKKQFDKNDMALFDAVRQAGKSSILLINKVDLVDKRFLLPLIEKCSKMGIFKDFIPISAKHGDNMKVLEQKIFEFLPAGDKFFPDDHLTDRPQRFFISEAIRKQVLDLTKEEVPHSVAVLVEEVKSRPKNTTYIQATIFVERESQKGIIIGKSGRMLKNIGEAAREDIEKQLQTKVFLQLWVKVYKNWRCDPRALKMLGYAE
jgi:GTP-binding protein Era